MTMGLPDDLYPFIDERLPLSELAIIDAPADLEQLLRVQAAQNGISIARGIPVELGAIRPIIRMPPFWCTGRSRTTAFICWHQRRSPQVGPDSYMGRLNAISPALRPTSARRGRECPGIQSGTGSAA